MTGGAAAGWRVSLPALWAGGWALWLATGAALPLPPWAAETRLAGEQAQAQALAASPEWVPLWSVNPGATRQQGVLLEGWAVNEMLQIRTGRDALGRTFAISRPGRVVISFRSPGWASAGVALWLRPVGVEAAPLRLSIDLQPPVELEARRSGAPVSVAAGPLGAGVHYLVFDSPTELELEAVAAGDASRLAALAVAASAPGDCGYAGWIQSGLDDRPALFTCGSGPAPPGAAQVLLDGGRVRGAYAFGGARRGGPLSALLSAVHGLAGVVLTLLVPGLAWTRRRGLDTLGRVLAFSTLLALLAFVALRLAGWSPRPLSLAALLAGLSGLGLARLRPEERGLRVPGLALAAGLAVLPLLVAFAGRVVPALPDQDLEVQATADGLARRQVPATVTDRGTTWFFAHPPLLHVWVAAAFVLEGRLGRVADAAELAVEARREAPFREPVPDEPPPYLGQWQRLLSRFVQEPQLWPTRQTNVVLGALAVATLTHLAARVTGSRSCGLALGLLLASFPEFLVRASYGGYFASTTLLSLLLLAWPRHAADRSWTASLAALSDQKGLLVPLAWLLAAPRSEGWRRAVPLLAAVAGLGLFVGWGLLVDAPTFVYDFVRTHVLQRLALNDVRFGPGEAWYPSIPDLWREFARNYGLLFTCAAAWAALRGTLRGGHRARVAGAAVLVAALVFSLTDWRQTKHLSLLIAPALVGMAEAWAAFRPRPRRLGLVLLMLMILGNCWLSARLAADFSALRPSTVW